MSQTCSPALNMATTTIAAGKARVASNKGLPVPENSLIDPDGQPRSTARIEIDPQPEPSSQRCAFLTRELPIARFTLRFRLGQEELTVPLKNILLVFASILVSIVVAEGVVRYIDGYRMLSWPLSEPIGAMVVKPGVMEQVPRAAGVEPAWFFTDPAPLPNRKPVPE